MSIRSLANKLLRVFHQVHAGYLRVDGVKQVVVKRLDRELQVEFIKPNIWNITAPNVSEQIIHPDDEKAFARAVELLAQPDEDFELLTYMALSDQTWREYGDQLVTEVMMDLRPRLEDRLVIRDNINLFSKIGDNVRISVDAEPGWFTIIGNCIDKIKMEMQALEWADHRIAITCIKQKFAGLRIYYQVLRKDGEEVEADVVEGVFQAIVPHINVAETLARCTCEACGKPGKMWGGFSQYMQTLCDDHASLRKLEESPDSLISTFAGDPLDFLEFMRKEKQ